MGVCATQLLGIPQDDAENDKSAPQNLICNLGRDAATFFDMRGPENWFVFLPPPPRLELHLVTTLSLSGYVMFPAHSHPIV